MKNFKVIWEIDVEDVQNPVEAVWNAVLLLEDNAIREQVYKVIDKDTKREYIVDLYDIDVHAEEVIPGTYDSSPLP